MGFCPRDFQSLRYITYQYYFPSHSPPQAVNSCRQPWVCPSIIKSVGLQLCAANLISFLLNDNHQSQLLFILIDACRPFLVLPTLISFSTVMLFISYSVRQCNIQHCLLLLHNHCSKSDIIGTLVTAVGFYILDCKSGFYIRIHRQLARTRHVTEEKGRIILLQPVL